MGREKSAVRRRANRRRGVAAQFAPRPFLLFLSSPCSFAFRAPFSFLFAVFLLFYCLSFLFPFLFLSFFLPILPFVSFSFFFLSFFFSFMAPTRPTPRKKTPAGGASPARMAESMQVALRRPNLAIPRFGYIFPLGRLRRFAAPSSCRGREGQAAGIGAARGRDQAQAVGAKSRARRTGGFEPHLGAARRMAPLPPPLPLRAPRPAGRAFCARSSVMRVFRRLPGSGCCRGAAVSRRRVALPAPAVCFVG